jgi:hypothetical protein
MKYSKPEVVVVAEAVTAIQSLAKGQGIPDNSLQQPSSGAYESDE